MYLDRAECELEQHDLTYWRYHFFCHDDTGREEVLLESTENCTTWDECLEIARSMPFAVDPELCSEGDIPFRINNFFSSGDAEAADVMLNAAYEALEEGRSWQEIITKTREAERQWRQTRCISRKSNIAI